VYDLLIPTLREGGEFGFLTATFTPRGKQHWTYDVFGTGRPDTALITARSFENPFLPPEFFETIKQQYGESSNLARQELYGEFIDDGGLMFRRSWFKIVDNVPEKFRRVVRFWDLAASVPKKLGDDPDWTVGCKIGRTEEGQFYIIDIRRIRGTPMEVESLVKRTAEEDGKGVGIRMEQEPGASGVAVIDHYARTVLIGYDYKGNKSSGPKEERARPFSAAAENGNVFVKRAQWVTTFLDELEGFPFGPHDDQVDAASAAMNEVSGPHLWTFGVAV
jgi:predicted phage terminase large subunit-like protein